MQIIPVLDIQNGVVVRGIGGRRNEYRPIESKLVASADPLDVAAAFRAIFGLSDLYIADLDAIGGARPALPVFETLQSSGFALWVDAGLRSAGEAAELERAGVSHFVAGLETLRGPHELACLCAQYGNRVVFSLDLKGGQALAVSNEWRGAVPFEIAQQAVELGVRRILVLDLLRVGSGAGTGTEELCRQILEAHADVAVIAGGGVAGLDDLRRLRQLGVNAALVASALHDGRLNAPIVLR